MRVPEPVTEITKVSLEGATEVSSLLASSWWCGFLSSDIPCGPNCCRNGECCQGPYGSYCASPSSCALIQCTTEVCDGRCCPEERSYCCAISSGRNVCVEDSDKCAKIDCQSIGGETCGDQCCKGNLKCCPGLNHQVCATTSQCRILKCIQDNGQTCGENCCNGEQFCCAGECMPSVEDCFAQQCLNAQGQICGRTCCRAESKDKGLCCENEDKSIQTCLKDAKECQIRLCPQWCHPHDACCKQESNVCCPKTSGLVCAANAIFCDQELIPYEVEEKDRFEAAEKERFLRG